jgi:hypothetical protein
VILAGNKQSEQARGVRRMYPIHFYSGRNGSGKSLAAVYDTLPTLEAGRRVLSTVRILDWQNPRPCEFETFAECGDVMHPNHLAAHPLYERFAKWEQLLDFHGGDVVMDEITGVADSAEWAALPSAVRNKLPQLRRHDIAVRITGLAWMRATKSLRESVNAVTVCRSSMPARRNEDNKLWRPRRMAHWKTYDAQSLPVDDHTKTAYANADLIVKARHWIPSSVAIHCYDTLAPVAVVGSVTDAGRCAYCGGTRRAAECSCADYQAVRTAAKATARADRPNGREHRAERTEASSANGHDHTELTK